MSEAFHSIRDEVLAYKDDKDLDSLYFDLSDAMDETFVSVAGKVNKIKPHMLADWFEEGLGTMRQEVDMIGLMNDGHITEKDDEALLFGVLCERYYDEHFAKMGFSSEKLHYKPHMMASFLDAPDVSDADKLARYKKYRDAVSVDEVYNLDRSVDYKSWDNRFTNFRYSNASFSEYCSDWGVIDTDLKNRRYLEDAAYAQGRGLTSSLHKNVFAGLNGENAGFDKVEACIGHTVEVGQDFLANMNAVSGIVGYGIKKAFRAAGDDRGYGYVLEFAVTKAQKKHLEPKSFVSYVRKCGVSNLIYNAAWASMNGAPIETMKGLAYSRVCETDKVRRYDVNDDVAIDIVNRFCDNKEAALTFENATNGVPDVLHPGTKNSETVLSQEIVARKELDVPVDDKSDELEEEK